MQITELVGKGGKLVAVHARDRETGEELRFEPAAAFVFIGLDPSSGFLRGTVDLGERGFVLTDGQFRTSLEGSTRPATCGPGARSSSAPRSPKPSPGS